MKDERYPGDDPELFKRATEGLDYSEFDEGAEDPYPLIPLDEIISDDEGYLPMGILGRLANDVLTRARAQANGELLRTPEHHRKGWAVTIDTEAGPVKLWNCWIGDMLELSYPGDPIADADIERVLGVESSGSTFSSPEFKGPVLPEGDRVWFETEKARDSPRRIINSQRMLERTERLPNVISTVASDHSNDGFSDPPNSSEEAIQEYTRKFILLAAEIALRLGPLKGVSTEFGFIMTPEDLVREGYTTQQVKGAWGERKGWGNEIVIGTKDNETIVLESANLLVPWVNVRRLEITESITSPYHLATRIIQKDLFF